MSGLRAILAATALVTLLCAPAAASARSNDLAATHAYIQANYRLARAGVALTTRSSSSSARSSVNMIWASLLWQ